MCGRYILDKDIDIIEKRFGAGLKGKHTFTPRYNVAPSQTMPVVTTPDELTFLPWGYAPKWGKKAVINARVEGLSDKPYFRDAGRCLVPATGFYEWKREGSKKVPYYFYLPDQSLFAFAGVCNENGYAIVTADANESVKDVHERMPVVLLPEAEQAWLSGTTNEPVPATLVSRTVSTAVNNPANDTVELLA